jgi:transcriptional regulator with XRE-family HTH domain
MAQMSIVARRLRQARERAGISQRELGIRAGIDPFAASARINQYERGKHVPDIWTAARLARVLGVPSAYLYAQDNALAAWILAFGQVSPTERRALFAGAAAKGTRTTRLRRP